MVVRNPSQSSPVVREFDLLLSFGVFPSTLLNYYFEVYAAELKIILYIAKKYLLITLSISGPGLLIALLANCNFLVIGFHNVVKLDFQFIICEHFSIFKFVFKRIGIVR